VRSRLHGIDINGAVRDVIGLNVGGLSHAIDMLRGEFLTVAYEMQRPSVVFKPEVFQDGDAWCCLLGENIQVGVVGFGDTPDKACAAFDQVWHNGNAKKEPAR
jgi:hypothetical protein